MPPNFIECDREQAFLMPPSLRDWVPEDHLVWTILEAVDEMDLSDFYADYRSDGHGRPAYDPRMRSRCCSTPMRAGTAPRAGSSANAERTSPTG
jgi:transposase